jgi:hypothetical protein
MAKILTKTLEEIVRILGHRVVWSKGNIVGLDQSITNKYMKQQYFTKLDAYPPYIGLSLFKTFILSVIRFHATGMIIFKQIDKGKNWWKHLYNEMSKILNRYIATPKDEQKYLTERGISFDKIVLKYGNSDISKEFSETIPEQHFFIIKIRKYKDVQIDKKIQ